MPAAAPTSRRQHPRLTEGEAGTPFRQRADRWRGCIRHGNAQGRCGGRRKGGRQGGCGRGRQQQGGRRRQPTATAASGGGLSRAPSPFAALGRWLRLCRLRLCCLRSGGSPWCGPAGCSLGARQNSLLIRPHIVGVLGRSARPPRAVWLRAGEAAVGVSLVCSFWRPPEACSDAWRSGGDRRTAGHAPALSREGRRRRRRSSPLRRASVRSPSRAAGDINIARHLRSGQCARLHGWQGSRDGRLDAGQHRRTGDNPNGHMKKKEAEEVSCWISSDDRSRALCSCTGALLQSACAMRRDGCALRRQPTMGEQPTTRPTGDAVQARPAGPVIASPVLGACVDTAVLLPDAHSHKQHQSHSSAWRAPIPAAAGGVAAGGTKVWAPGAAGHRSPLPHASVPSSATTLSHCKHRRRA